ncbi:hypothetical protein L596_023461 [Steinernema carpocapsae]|uniref:F-box domain-containing protein n=1 Tax=Steinernema carpocapsae TaxID=34508 RepID=A0A4V5ZZF3_STECR|nr:hypothetical protein L596_023461 [Steinernema carpocapsae]
MDFVPLSFMESVLNFCTKREIQKTFLAFKQGFFADVMRRVLKLRVELEAHIFLIRGEAKPSLGCTFIQNKKFFSFSEMATLPTQNTQIVGVNVDFLPWSNSISQKYSRIQESNLEAVVRLIVDRFSSSPLLRFSPATDDILRTQQIVYNNVCRLFLDCNVVLPFLSLYYFGDLQMEMLQRHIAAGRTETIKLFGPWPQETLELVKIYMGKTYINRLEISSTSLEIAFEDFEAFLAPWKEEEQPSNRTLMFGKVIGFSSVLPLRYTHVDHRGVHFYCIRHPKISKAKAIFKIEENKITVSAFTCVCPSTACFDVAYNKNVLSQLESA